MLVADRAPVEGGQAVDGASNRDDPQRIALRVRVVGQELLRRDGHRAALPDGERVVNADRWVVDRAHRDGDDATALSVPSEKA